MPSLSDNRERWESYSWPEGGDEWSHVWGSSRTMWHVTIAPRLAGRLPAGTVLEIAPGYGRVTEYLMRSADRLIAVDLASRCVEACQVRFADEPRVEVHQNDGQSLDMVSDDSVDLAFSWDALVHVARPELRSYLAELERCLRPGGVAMLHHSNFAAVQDQMNQNRHWRADDVDHELFQADCRAAGLVCAMQELIPWDADRLLTDCFSLIQLPEERTDMYSPCVVVENPGFCDEWRRARALHEMWGTRSAAEGQIG